MFLNLRGNNFECDGTIRKKKNLNIEFLGGSSWDIRDPDVGISRTKTLCKWPFSVVLDREWPGCPGIWVGTSRIWKIFMQENFGLFFFRALYKFGHNLNQWAKTSSKFEFSPVL